MGWIEGLLRFAEDFLPFLGRLLEGVGEYIGPLLYLILKYWWVILVAFALCAAFTSPLWLYSWKKQHALSLSFFEIGVGLCLILSGVFGFLSGLTATGPTVLTIIGGGFVGVRGLDNLKKASERPETTVS